MLHRLALLIPFFILVFSINSYGYVVIATETARGEWEDGKFTQGKPEFKYRIEIDEKNGKALVTEITRFKDNTIIEANFGYVIVSSESGSEVSSLLLTSPARQGQQTITLIGKPGALATEIFLISQKYFEYLKASSGRFYLSSGNIQKSTTLIDAHEKVILK